MPATADLVDWLGFITQLEREVAELEAALADDAEALPELAPMAQVTADAVPAELRPRAEAALRAVFELEQAIADRLEQVARELSLGDARRRDLTPSYGHLDVDC